MCRPNAREPQTPFWTRRCSKESNEDYLRRVLQLQGSRSQPILQRRGSGCNLGFPKKEGDSTGNRVKQLQLEGVPSSWDAYDISHGLTSLSLVVRKNDGFSKRHAPFGPLTLKMRKCVPSNFI